LREIGLELALQLPNPVTVTLKNPAELPEQESVEVIEVPAEILVGLRLQVNPLGDEAVRVTVPLKP